nr:bone marrow proteoglycan isoform X2 [Equus caballus]
MPEHGTMEAPMEGLTLLEEEEEGGSGGEDAPEEEGAVKSVSALEEVDKDFQCPKEEDTVKQGSCWHFYWGDGSAWKIWYWALSQPLASGGSCVSMWNREGGWRLPHCKAFLLCVCSYLAGPSPEFRAAPSLGPASPPMPAAPSSTTQE